MHILLMLVAAGAYSFLPPFDAIKSTWRKVIFVVVQSVLWASVAAVLEEIIFELSGVWVLDPLFGMAHHGL